MASESFVRSALDYPLSIKTARHYLRTAKTSAERKVWRDLLNSEAYNKHVAKSRAQKAKEEAPAKKSKKK